MILSVYEIIYEEQDQTSKQKLTQNTWVAEKRVNKFSVSNSKLKYISIGTTLCLFFVLSFTLFYNIFELLQNYILFINL
jgi:hypothetical protein